MARDVTEWQGKNDDTPAPARVKLRILHRQKFKCALTGRPIKAGANIDFDHIVELIMGGKNTEQNLQAVLREAHKEKTKAAIKRKAKADNIAKSAFDLRAPTTQPIQSKGFVHKAKNTDRIPVPPRRALYGETR
jgi:5-methylcytosine-specific restriction protein A